MSQSVIDIRKLPKPKIIEELSFSQIREELLGKFKESFPGYNLIESDPAVKLLEVAAYREVLLRERINEAVRQTMPAYAEGSNLDNIAVRFRTGRWINEKDETFLDRTLGADDLPATAGSKAGYIAHARLAVSPEILLDVDAVAGGIGTGKVFVYCLFKKEEKASVREKAIASIKIAINKVRPITDFVEVLEAKTKEFSFKAALEVPFGADPLSVQKQALSSIRSLFYEACKIGHSIPFSRIYAALHEKNDVLRATIIHPSEEYLTVKDGEALVIGDGEKALNIEVHG